MEEKEIELIKQMIFNCRNLKEYKDEQAENKAIALEHLLKSLEEKDKRIKELEEIEKEHREENGKLRMNFDIVDHECSRLEQKEIWLENQIDLMAEKIYVMGDFKCDAQMPNLEMDCTRCKGRHCKECIKQYFENKAKGVEIDAFEKEGNKDE